jgi:hypothetical protein
MSSKHYFIAITTLIIGLFTAFLLHGMGRLWLSESGAVYFWVSDAWGDQNSQHLADPYSFSHFLHGVLFFGLLYCFRSKISLGWRFNTALFIESLWELLENSSLIINRYRDAGALGYSGDTVLNSMGDLLACALGFVAASYLGLKKSLLLFLMIEILSILIIRDSLILNCIMLIHPVEAIQKWQSVMIAN